jgi:hypothetical protein
MIMEVEARWLRWMTGLVLGTAVSLIILIAVGTFDPKPVGKLQWERPLTPQTIAAGSQRIIWLESITPLDNYSLRLQTTYQNGETDILYGLVIGDEDDYWVMAISPLGYATAFQPSAFSLQPFAPWPHVHPDENEIWLDVVNGRVTIRLNRELYWTGTAAPVQGKIGLWVESFGETAVIDFPTLQLYAADNR